MPRRLRGAADTERELADQLTGGGGGGDAESQPNPAPGSTLPGPFHPWLGRHRRLLVVGDSLEVLTSPYLGNYLPENRLVINAVGGYSSLQIFELFQESYDASQAVIVFDAGTNDNPNYPEILAGRLQAVSEIVGDRCMVVPTIHGLSSTGSTRPARTGSSPPSRPRARRRHPRLGGLRRGAPRADAER